MSSPPTRKPDEPAVHIQQERCDKRVEIRDHTLFIDGQPLDEPYLAQHLQRDYGPITTPPLHVLVMGDNRMVSYDSRAFGPVPIEDIRGRAWLRVWPIDKIGLVK
jgi:signal peptidase I